ncbi:hypothetical protein MMC14_000795 [Varicellaria rhodocarpa]|nr:hypothetical protein [Varicellaria rhodocarpa]
MTRTDRPLANDFITEVCHRWQAHRVLRKLYLSEKVKAEYDLSRAKFTGSANHQHSHRFGAEFGGRFHKAICLHSVAIASRKLAIASQFSGPDQEEDVFQTVFDLWNKKSVVDEWGNDAEPSIQDKLDCLEVFDFLYLFVTTRLFVTEFPSWTGAIMNEWQFAGHALDTNPQAAQLLEICLLYGRWTLSPTDLAGLMSRGNDTPRLSWPVDKHRYLALRGAFDRGTPTDLDVVSQTERWSMVRAVVGSNERGDCFDTSTPCWWDRLRQLVGSPFQPNFLERTLWKLRRGDQRDKVYLYLLQTEIREELF